MMKFFIYLMYLCISMFYVYGQGDHNHQSLSGIHAPGQHGNELNLPALHLPPGATINDARAAGVIPDIVKTDSKGISNSNLHTATSDVTLDNSLPGSKVRNTGKAKIILDLFRKQTAPLSESADVNGFQRSEFGILDNQSVLLTRGNRRRDGRRGGKRRGRNRGGGKKRRTTTTTTSSTTTTQTTTTTTTTTTPAPKKSGGNNGIMIIKTSRPNPFASLGNVFRSALNVRSAGNGGLLGSLIGPSLVQQSSGPVRLQPVGRPLFGGLFGGR